MSLTLSRRVIRNASTSFVAHESFNRLIVMEFFISLDTPKSLAAYLLFSNDEHEQLLDLDVNPAHYLQNQGDKFHRDYAACAFLSKSDFLKTSHDKKGRGLAKFRQFEEQCKETNSRFKSDSVLERTEYATWLFTMRRKIDLILGDFDIEEFFAKSAWGPGVTTLLKGEDTSATRKYQSEIGITRDAYALMSSSLAAAYPTWFREEHVSDSSLQIEAGNTITTVPKNSKIDRVIAVEPGLNLYFQKGVGAMIKKRLRNRGVNLTNQGNNQQSALVGSLSGDLATVDFSSASDSISKEIVRHLLPLRWYTVMNSLRCKTGLIDGESFEWEKFSSMGNGFTFELESLIFYAAALTTCEYLGVDNSEISVYGDDVIIPSTAFDAYEKFCKFLGFTVNTDKSFSSGVFRESCGSHYFNGFDVKPIFLKKPLSDAFSLFKLANSIRRLSHRRNFNCGCDRRFLTVWRCIIRGLPQALRSLRIPDGYGDGGVLSNFDEATPPTLPNGWEGFRVLVLAERGVKRHQDCHGLLVERLTQIQGQVSIRKLVGRGTLRYISSSLSDQAYNNDVTLRGRVLVNVSDLVVHSWYNLGGWH